jgi:hypothetical protein
MRASTFATLVRSTKSIDRNQDRSITRQAVRDLSIVKTKGLEAIA